MFSQLGDKLQDIFKDLRGQGAISETNVNDAMRQVRLALLEADVHFQVAKTFIARVQGPRRLAQEVLRSVTPGQQIVKIFQDELTTLLGGDAEPLNLDKPGRIMMVGLNGAGKDDLVREARAVPQETGPHPGAHRMRLAAAGGHRAAWATLAGQVGVPMFRPQPGETDLLKVGSRRRRPGRRNNRGERADLRHGRASGNRRGARARNSSSLREMSWKPQEVLLVADAATGSRRSASPRTSTRRSASRASC